MALSQKHIGKQLVPWFCKAEWDFVYNNIYGKKSTDNTKREALKILYIWKSRTPLLPCGVEGTFIILEVMLLNHNSYNDYNVRLLISSSIMRFLNLCASYNKTQTTFLQSAREMKLPNWLITLRHDTAHSQHLPSLDILHRALKYSFNWLKREYWDPARNELTDFVDSLEISDDNYKAKLEPLLTNYCYLNLITHPHWNYKQFSDIGDEEVRNALLDELSELNNIQTITTKTKISRVIKVLWQNIETVLVECQDIRIRNDIFVKLLLEEDVFLGSFDERAAVLTGENLDKIPRRFLYLWEPLLMYMHQNKMLNVLITQLLSFLSKSSETDDRKLMAAFWLDEIAKGLIKCKLAQKIYNGRNNKDFTSDLPEVILLQFLKGKCEELYGRTRSFLNLSYFGEIPEIFVDPWKLNEFVLQEPNEYTKYFIYSFLQLQDDLHPSINDILELYASYIGDTTENVSVPKIHTVEDILQMDIDSEEIINTDQENPVTSEKQRWTKVTELDFEKCPLGILPWQSTKTNPLLD